MVDEDKAVRIPATMLSRADALVPLLAASSWGEAVKWNTTALVRLAMSRGLASLESEFGSVVRPVEAPRRSARQGSRGFTTKHTLTRERVEALMVEAGSAGDERMVATCRRALDGSGRAWAECVKAIRWAESMSDE